MTPPAVALAEVERLLDRLYVAAEGASLRNEDRRKAIEVAAFLGEIARVTARAARGRRLTLVDAAAGKSYVGLLTAALLWGPAGRAGQIVAIERDPSRSAASQAAAATLETAVRFTFTTADVGDPAAWPPAPDLVTALHACGPAADHIIDRACAAEARTLLLVPCCTGAAVFAADLAGAAATACAIPRQAPVRRRFVQAIVDAERTWRLEAAGYETEVVELCPPTVTPHNLLWRARRVRERGRMAAAEAALARLRALG